MAHDVQDRVRALLDSLGMRDGLTALEAALGEEPAKRVAALAAMERVLQAEANARNERRIQRRLDDSDLPDRPTLEAFDFDFQPGLDRDLVLELATLAWVDRREDLVLVGQSGTGKSHIAKALCLIASGLGEMDPRALI
jgi:DNA replication protein DnaC